MAYQAFIGKGYPINQETYFIALNNNFVFLPKMT